MIYWKFHLSIAVIDYIDSQLHKYNSENMLFWDNYNFISLHKIYQKIRSLTICLKNNHVPHICKTRIIYQKGFCYNRISTKFSLTTLTNLEMAVKNIKKLNRKMFKLLLKEGLLRMFSLEFSFRCSSFLVMIVKYGHMFICHLKIIW